MSSGCVAVFSSLLNWTATGTLSAPGASGNLVAFQELLRETRLCLLVVRDAKWLVEHEASIAGKTVTKVAGKLSALSLSFGRFRRRSSATSQPTPPASRAASTDALGDETLAATPIAEGDGVVVGAAAAASVAVPGPQELSRPPSRSELESPEVSQHGECEACGKLLVQSGSALPEACVYCGEPVSTPVSAPRVLAEHAECEPSAGADGVGAASASTPGRGPPLDIDLVAPPSPSLWDSEDFVKLEYEEAVPEGWLLGQDGLITVFMARNPPPTRNDLNEYIQLLIKQEADCQNIALLRQCSYDLGLDTAPSSDAEANDGDCGSDNDDDDGDVDDDGSDDGVGAVVSPEGMPIKQTTRRSRRRSRARTRRLSALIDILQTPLDVEEEGLFLDENEDMFSGSSTLELGLSFTSVEPQPSSDRASSDAAVASTDHDWFGDGISAAGGGGLPGATRPPSLPTPPTPPIAVSRTPTGGLSMSFAALQVLESGGDDDDDDDDKDGHLAEADGHHAAADADDAAYAPAATTEPDQATAAAALAAAAALPGTVNSFLTCVEYLSGPESLAEEGLWRISGSLTEVDGLAKQIMASENAAYPVNLGTIADPNVVAGAFKRISIVSLHPRPCSGGPVDIRSLRVLAMVGVGGIALMHRSLATHLPAHLDVPAGWLINPPRQHYGMPLDAASALGLAASLGADNAAADLYAAVDALPPHRRIVFSALAAHLAKVVASPQTRMTAQALAISVGRTLFPGLSAATTQMLITILCDEPRVIEGPDGPDLLALELAWDEDS